MQDISMRQYPLMRAKMVSQHGSVLRPHPRNAFCLPPLCVTLLTSKRRQGLAPTQWPSAVPRKGLLDPAPHRQAATLHRPNLVPLLPHPTPPLRQGGRTDLRITARKRQLYEDGPPLLFHSIIGNPERYLRPEPPPPKTTACDQNEA